ncbi:MAG: hypothetical protein ACRDCE_14300, partial [Cetobacterium sp.]|uniref:hypothetical protein n=1 Tax=Cetobacterium sp. TaxID=2071632 RepID=UPI003EE5FFFE
ALRGEYLAFGTYPGCTRSTDSKLLVELLKEGYKPITEKEIVCNRGFRPSRFILPIDDGTVKWHPLWDYLLLNCENPHSPWSSAKLVKGYYESK